MSILAFGQSERLAMVRLRTRLPSRPAFAQQDGGRGVAVGDDFHVHGNYPSISCELITSVIQHLHGNTFTLPNTPFLLHTRHLTQNERQISLELQARG